MAIDEPAPTASQMFARNLRAIRQRRNWTRARLAKQLEVVGTAMETSTIARLESGNGRSPTIEEALMLAFALGADPVEMFLPRSRKDNVRIGVHDIPSGDVRRWLRGKAPLRDADRRTYFTEVSDDQIEAYERFIRNGELDEA